MRVMEFFTVRLAQLTFHKVTCTNIQSRLHCPSAYAAGTLTAQNVMRIPKDSRS